MFDFNVVQFIIFFMVSATCTLLKKSLLGSSTLTLEIRHFLTKLNIRILCNQAIFTPRYFPKRKENMDQQRYLCANVQSSFSHDSKRIVNNLNAQVAG